MCNGPMLLTLDQRYLNREVLDSPSARSTNLIFMFLNVQHITCVLFTALNADKNQKYHHNVLFNNETLYPETFNKRNKHTFGRKYVFILSKLALKSLTFRVCYTTLSFYINNNY